MQKKTVLVIFGGHNTEYYASCDSVGGMLDYIDRDRYNVLTLGVTMEGDWILTEATSKEVSDGKGWLKCESNKEAFIAPMRNRNELTVMNDDGTVSKVHIDCVFPLISGYGGEDGSIQGLLEIAGIPYVGSRVSASACGMDKAITRYFAEKCGLKQPEAVVLRKNEYKDLGQVKSLMNFGYPVYVKPASLGSSVGISKADNDEELEKAILLAFDFERKILIEEGIKGSELKAAVSGNDELKFGSLCELKVVDGRFNDYAMKHQTFTSQKTIPANVPETVYNEMIRQCTEIYKALDCKGFARIDFFLTDENELVFNEINTVPGIGKGSIYSRMFEASGVELTTVLTDIIESAFDENAQQIIFGELEMDKYAI